MAFDAGSLLSFLKLDTTGFSTGLSTAKGKVNQFDTSIAKSDKTLKGMSGTAAGLGKLMLTGLGFFAAFKAVSSFTKAIGDSIDMAADLEKSMANVATLVDTTVVNMDELTESVLDMTSEVLKSSEDLSAGLYQVFSAGITDSAEAMEVLRVSAIAATAGLSDTRTSVDAITTVLNAYGLEASRATDVSDLLFQTVKLGKTTFSELANAIGTVISPAAAVGVELDELFATLATLTKGGIDTRTATTALRATLLSVLKPTDQAKKKARELGIEWNAQALKAKGLIAFLGELREKTQGNAEDITAIVPNVRALNAVLATVGKQWEELINIQGQFVDRAGSTQEAFSKQADTFVSKVLRMELAIDRLQTALGNLILPVITAPIEDLADNLELLLDAFKGLRAFFDIGFKGKDSEFFKTMEENLVKLAESRKKAVEEIRAFTDPSTLFKPVGEFKLPEILLGINTEKEEAIRLDEKQTELIDELIAKSKELGKTERELFEMSVAEIDKLLFKKLSSTEGINEKEINALHAIQQIRNDLRDQEKLAEFQAENERVAKIVSFEQRKLQIQKSFMKQFENVGLTQLQVVERNEKRAIAKATEMGQQTAQITKFFEEKKTQIRQEEFAKQLSVASDFASATANLSSNLNELLVSQGEEKSKELFAITKAASISTALINTYTAASAAYRTPPPPVGIALAALITAAGLTQVARISKQKLAEGGLVTRPTNALVGEVGPEAVIPIERGVAPILEKSVENVVEDEGRVPAPISIINILDPRMIEAVVAQYVARTNKQTVLNVINNQSIRAGI
jgi:TP901 family phage tail tape measure protein